MMDDESFEREKVEGVFVRVAEGVMPSFWSEHKKQSVLKYIRRWIRDMTTYELLVKNSEAERPRTFEAIGRLVVEAGRGYDRYIERCNR